MIAGATRGAGGAALGAHLARADHNEEVRLGHNRGLTAEGIRDQIDELTRMGSHAKTAQPIYHVHADPPAGRPWNDEERARYWELFEREFGLEGRPFASAIHVKEGREHEHRAYLRIKPNGTAIRLDHDHARREKISRIMEFERGEPLTKGAHNRAVIAALMTERPEIAEAMRAAGLHEGSRPRAETTPKERAQAERTGISKRDIATATAMAWTASDNGPAFAHALKAQGLHLAMGDKVALIVDSTGNGHSLQRMLSMHARSTGEQSPKSADISARLGDMDLPSLRNVKAEILNPQPPAPTPPTPPPSAPSPAKSEPQGSPPEASGKKGGGSDTPQKSAPSPSIGGGGGGAPAHENPVAPASLEPAGDGPGEPPKVGASPDELAKYRAKLHAYEERKEQALQRFFKALAAQEMGKKKGGNQPAPSSEEPKNVRNDWQKNGIIEAIRKGYEEAHAKRELNAALEKLADWDGSRSRQDEESPTQRPNGSGKISGSGGPDSGHENAQGKRGADTAPTIGRQLGRSDGSAGGNSGLEHAEGEKSGRNLGIQSRDRGPTFSDRAENARVNFALAFTDLTRLEKAREALRPQVPDLTEGMGNREKSERLKEWRGELVDRFKRDKSDLRFVQRHDWKASFGQLKYETDAVRAVLDKHRGRVSREMYQEAFEARKKAREDLGKSLKEGQERQKESFSDWLQREAYSDPKALAVHQDMERRKAEKVVISNAIDVELNRIASERAKAPFPDPATRSADEMERRVRHAAYAPLHAAQESLKAAIGKLADTPKATGIRAFFGIPTKASRKRDAAEQAVSLAHAAVEAAKPNRTMLEDAKHHARHDAERAARQFQSWHQQTGQELDRRESLVLGIQETLENGDPKMRKTLLEGGIEAALKLQAMREAEEARKLQEEQKLARGNVVPLRGEQGIATPRMR